jgi:hypothetical protein
MGFFKLIMPKLIYLLDPFYADHGGHNQIHSQLGINQLMLMAFSQAHSGPA